jgi:hypothetical protein
MGLGKILVVGRLTFNVHSKSIVAFHRYLLTTAE